MITSKSTIFEDEESVMKLRSAILFGIVMLFGTVTLAQDYAKVEVPMQFLSTVGEAA